MDEEAPVIEKIHTRIYERQENRKRVSAHLRRSNCYKAAYSHKQALTSKNMLLAMGTAPYLNIYKCKKCGYWHLTSQLPRH